ncbi:BspA family leucine-rich repeat surface protein [Niabella ginsengisoli]|uniref:DUF285 domain-containing protein n=1 Tax=Niabella ginsengisoli TaxID=522298 RepID=A0ABS9SS19_9BACT|nr:DUF285 domain-containing protein [Niabella ginsengisoli]MCH5600934.1 DUF285 domain-containing protein [Niabella ginsengisoli]
MPTGGTTDNTLTVAVQTSGTASYTWSKTSGTGVITTGSGSFSASTFAGNNIDNVALSPGDVLTLSVTPTNLRRFSGNGADATKLIDVTQWGAVPWSSMNQAFNACSNLNITATDIPNLSNVTSMRNMFFDCSNLNGPANINSWDVSNVTDMFGTFVNTTVFNQDISSWNTANVTTMQGMFIGASAFNQDISGWNTGMVNNMAQMFNNAIAFNQDISGWNTASVTNMSRLFNNADAFNQDISGWNTANVTNMSRMFDNADAFNQNIGGWNTGGATNMSSMFINATAFNQDISDWNTGSVTNMSNMFNGATAFDQNLGNWDISSVNSTAGQSMADMLSNNGMGCVNYSRTLLGWANGSSGAAVPSNVILGATGRTYSPETEVETARNTTLPANGWVISGDAANASSCNIALPVTFGNVVARIQDGGFVVSWTTESEKACDHFEIEVSKDGSTWSKVGNSISSKATDGNSDESIEYEQSFPLSGMAVMGVSIFLLSMGMMFRRNKWLGSVLMIVGMSAVLYGCSKNDNDISATGEKVYVRIKQVDKDGTASYSKVVTAIVK